MTLVDLFDVEKSKMITIEIVIAENSITFTTEHLATNRSYNVTVRASNIAGSATSYTTIEVSTVSMSTATTVEQSIAKQTLTQEGNLIKIFMACIYFCVHIEYYLRLLK